MSTAQNGQEALYRPGICIDQHDRKWSGLIDKKTGYPVGVLKPHGWTAPFRPSQGTNYFIFSKDEPNRFRINYEAMLEERLQADKEHNEDREAKAVVRGWDPEDPEKQEGLDRIAQKRKTKAVAKEIIIACMQGDPWTLGLTDRVNTKVQKFLPKKVTRTEALMEKFADIDLTAEPESLSDNLEARMDLQEQHDKDETPRGRVAVKPKAPKTRGAAA